FSNDNDAMHPPTHISKEEVDMDKLTFTPATNNADERPDPAQPGMQTPGLDQVPPSGPTTDERENSLPTQQSSIDDGSCPRCGHDERTSSMVATDTTYHECYRCGNSWETKEDVEGFEAGADLRWVLGSDEDEEDLSPRSAGMA